MNILSKLACAVALSFSLCAASFAETQSAPTAQEKNAALFYAMSSLSGGAKDTTIRSTTCTLGLFDCKQRELGPMSHDECESMAVLTKQSSREPWYRDVSVVCLSR
ncbi:hypothetical protein [Pseudomonas syringae group genomosp. 3]|uniref:Lipoprotein n=1 Tax=Pseudomonas syringae pv. persicae TaxID=237306 RepID=A0AB38ED71_9PSED|nr:hypothetical protein [Pseudomonas syringae group genomosp. 3]SOQ09177.1 hypothetical protein NCPPB2254_02218 [Pseudomonas syringae pv. persicae]SOQ09234.1 hypothetical protein CFBP1573P_02392 [Pseudomonas syringae pv. persicae]